jgi:hypothetical protein
MVMIGIGETPPVFDPSDRTRRSACGCVAVGGLAAIRPPVIGDQMVVDS